jgi:hypothetical protein
MPLTSHAGSSVIEYIGATGTPEPQCLDVADWLPEQSAAVLRRLREAKRDVRAAMEAVQDEIDDKRVNAQRVEAHLHRLREEFRLGEGDPRVSMDRQELERIRADIRTLSGHYAARAERSQLLGRIIENAERFIPAEIAARGLQPRHRRGQTLAGYRAGMPRLQKGETPADAVKRLRTVIAKLQSELDEVRNAPIPNAALRDRVRASVLALAEQGTPRIDPNGVVIWPQEAVHLGAFVRLPESAPETPQEEDEPRYPSVWDRAVAQRNRAVAVTRTPAGGGTAEGFAGGVQTNVLAVLCWADPERIIEKLEAGLPDAKGALSDEDRSQRLQELGSELLKVEREECCYIEMAAQQGTVIDHRPDGDPRAMLSLA